MSLLLDALQRASKDKEKLAAAAAKSDGATNPPAYLFKNASDAPDKEASISFDDVQLSPVEDTITPPPAPPEEVAASPVRVEPSPVVEMALELEPEPEPEPITAPASPTSPAPFADTPEASPPALTTTIISAAPPVAAAAPLSPPNASRVAQDMRRAYADTHAPAEVTRSRRVLVLGTIAGLLALGLAVLAYVMWNNSSALLGTSVLTPVAAPVAAEPEALVITPAPAAPYKEPSPAAPSSTATAVATSAVTTPAQEQTAASTTRTSNEVLVQGATFSKPTFVAKTREPNALEQGYAALLAGQWDTATTHYNRALRANPEERDALLGLAYIAQKQGKREEALAYYQRVLRQDPANANAQAALLALDNQSDSAQIASRTRDLAQRQPDSAATMSIAGQAAARSGQLADAAQLFARAQLLEPTNPLHTYNYAVALDRLSQPEAALTQYEKVARLLSGGANAVTAGAISLDAVQQRIDQLRQAQVPPASTTP